LFQYWIERGSFPDYSRPWMLPVWVIDQIISLCNYPYEPLGGIVLAMAVLGGVGFWRSGQRALVVAIVAPVVLTLGAALALQFPFGGARVTLFLTPGLVLLVARATGMIYVPFRLSDLRRRRGDWKGCLWLAPAALTAWALGLATYHVIVPRMKSHLRPVVAYVREHRDDDEPLYILGESRAHEFYCYWRRPPGVVRTTFEPSTAPEEPFWIVTGYNPKSGLKDIAGKLEQVRDLARETDRYVGIGGAAFRFDPREGELTLFQAQR
jgi:hypothetical protein